MSDEKNSIDTFPFLQRVIDAAAREATAATAPLPPDPAAEAFARRCVEIADAGRHWKAAIGDWHPAPILLAADGREPGEVLRILVGREVADALALAPAVSNGRLAEWVTTRLCGPDPLPSAPRLRFLLLVARAIRGGREVVPRSTSKPQLAQAQVPLEVETVFDQGPAVAGSQAAVGETTADSAPLGPLPAVASGFGSAAVALASISRSLEEKEPELDQIMLLTLYAGLHDRDIAGLLGRSSETVESDRMAAETSMLGQLNRKLGKNKRAVGSVG